MVMFGIANGLITIARGAVPLALFGAGRLRRADRPDRRAWLVMQAIAPLVLAFVAERASDPAALALVAVLALVSFVCLAGVASAEGAEGRAQPVGEHARRRRPAITWPSSPSSFGPWSMALRSCSAAAAAA